MVMLAIADTANDLSTTQGVMALAAVTKPGQPMNLLTNITSWPLRNPLRVLLNHLNLAFARPPQDHLAAERNFFERAAIPTPDNTTLTLLRTILGGNIPTDRARLALIMAMLREAGILPRSS